MRRADQGLIRAASVNVSGRPRRRVCREALYASYRPSRVARAYAWSGPMVASARRTIRSSVSWSVLEEFDAGAAFTGHCSTEAAGEGRTIPLERRVERSSSGTLEQGGLHHLRVGPFGQQAESEVLQAVPSSMIADGAAEIFVQVWPR